MQTRSLGHTGVRVSELCLGAMYFGTRTDEKTSFALLDQYVEAGGNFIDTANIYAHWIKGGQGGESEALLGRWLQARDNRHGLFIATKVGFELPGVERGLRVEQIEAECEKSLKRLGVDVIDLYYAHVDDRHTPLEETLAAFSRLVKAGKVRHVGASNYRAWRLDRARQISRVYGWPEFCCIQQRHTYLRPQVGASFAPQIVANEDLLDYCTTENITLLAYSVLLSGAYTRPERPIPAQYAGPDTEARLAALKAVAAETGRSPNQVVLAWLRQSTPSVLPLIAASSSAQLQENLDSLTLILDEGQMERLNQTGVDQDEE